MTAPKEIIKLVDRFERNRDQYVSGNYNEAQLRQEFINPFFSSLGWDVENQQGYAEPYKEVIHEDAIKIGSATKAPDYAFRIGGTRKFFVEAKNPSVNLREDATPSYQLRRYAWSAKLPLSVLTDFEEFVIYDCSTKPLKTDKAATGRVQYLTFRDYATQWDSIASVFSKESVLKGSFDKFAESSKGKKGTAEVDDAFLKEIESWRDLLAKNIALRNSKLSQRELNFAVQRTIDRIIFLRICEDRGIEQYGRLLALVNGERVYRRLYEQFARADEKYNSGLFHFESEKGRPEQPDELSPNLHIDDKPLREIIGNLYYPDCPYEFSVLPADILGQVYEQFLGKVIRLTAGHQAKVEEKPEVKKAGGVYYTPTYIVDYIVKNTVGKLLQPEPSPNKADVILNSVLSPSKDAAKRSEGSAPKPAKSITPKEASKLRILDPACGSGSFLIGAYQYLLDWHRDWYVNDGAEKHATGKTAALFRGPGGEWRLTTSERKRILLNNIYGVDIDSQAVEVTKLSLLLKVLEGENEQTISQQLKMFHERALPDLGSNIKCGNSLIGPDFYDGKQLSLLDDEEKNRINVFDWKKEFKEIMDGGGFDAVIGNPPWVRQELLADSKEYFRDHYTVHHGAADLYSYFIERSIMLVRKRGLFSFIIPNKWMRASYGEALRRWLKLQGLSEIVDFGDLRVFEKATTYPCIIRVVQGQVDKYISVAQIDTLAGLNLQNFVRDRSYSVDLANLPEGGWALATEYSSSILSKMFASSVPLGDYVHGEICRGVVSGYDDAFTINDDTRKKLLQSGKRSEELIKPYVMGRDVQRYGVLPQHRFLIFTRRGVNIDSYPAIRSYLEQFKTKLMPRPRDYKGAEWAGRKPGPYKWYEIQDSVEYFAELEKTKIVYLKFQVNPAFTLDADGFYPNSAVWAIPTDDKYLLGVLNSRVGWFLVSQTCTRIQNGYQLIWDYFKNIPIRSINLSDRTDRSRHDRMVQLVEQMLSLHKQLPAAKTEQEKTVIQRQIDATDKQIDQLVYELYGLTEEEIKIVEGRE